MHAPEFVEFRILETGMKVKSKLTALDFRREDLTSSKRSRLEDTYGTRPWSEGEPKKAG